MTATLDIDGVISEKVSRQDIAALRKAYLDQDEFETFVRNRGKVAS